MKIFHFDYGSLTSELEGTKRIRNNGDQNQELDSHRATGPRSNTGHQDSEVRVLIAVIPQPKESLLRPPPCFQIRTPRHTKADYLPKSTVGQSGSPGSG
jgi:hypothetical protein